jgi:DNA-binding response OmpR family regulator
LLDFAGESVALDGNQVQLTSKEYRLLANMVQHAGEILHRDALFRDVCGYGPDMQTRTLDVHVAALARSLATMLTGESKHSLVSGTVFNLVQMQLVPDFSAGPASPARSLTG